MMIQALRMWPGRRWSTALAAAVLTCSIIATPTALIATPFFGREIPAPWWAWPALIVASTLGGLLLATYVAAPEGMATGRNAGRGGWFGGVLTFFAVGCPVCNKIVLLALGSAGALTWFEPVQPVLQLFAVGLLAWALRSACSARCPAPAATPGKPMPEKTKAPLVPIMVAIAAAIALVVTLIWNGSVEEADTGPAATVHGTPANAQLPGLERRDANDPTAIGDVDAPVVMVEYSEFQCPFCGRFARDTAPTLVKEYVEQGVLRMEFRDFPYLGAESMVAAQAGRAAAAQDRFWDFHEAIFADQLPPNSGKLDQDYVVEVAKDLGLDVAQFVADMSSPQTVDSIEKDRDQGVELGITGTPAFIINGQLVMGAQPTEVFVEVIEAAAEAANE